MKTKTKITVCFTAEIVFFVMIGYYLALGNWVYSAISLIFAMTFAGATGKLIEKDAIERYKKEVENG